MITSKMMGRQYTRELKRPPVERGRSYNNRYPQMEMSDAVMLACWPPLPVYGFWASNNGQIIKSGLPNDRRVKFLPSEVGFAYDLIRYKCYLGNVG